eukprot:GHVS01049478.1.p1 GENE.GHVS01049478.1~~GHVS01049478.1.p1  ORF type:complete len:1625 (+),score=429.58 GHVS01049478.1:310-5184(+)
MAACSCSSACTVTDAATISPSLPFHNLFVIDETHNNNNSDNQQTTDSRQTKLRSFGVPDPSCCPLRTSSSSLTSTTTTAPNSSTSISSSPYPPRPTPTPSFHISPSASTAPSDSISTSSSCASTSSSRSSTSSSGLALRRCFLFHNHHLPSSSPPATSSSSSPGNNSSSLPLLPFSRWWAVASPHHKQTQPNTTADCSAADNQTRDNTPPPPPAPTVGSSSCSCAGFLSSSPPFSHTSSSPPTQDPPSRSSSSRNSLPPTKRCLCCCSAGQLCEAADACACCAARVLRFTYLSRRGYIPTIAEIGESEISSVSTANEMSAVSSLGGWPEGRASGEREEETVSEEEQQEREEEGLVALLEGEDDDEQTGPDADKSHQHHVNDIIIAETSNAGETENDRLLSKTREEFDVVSSVRLWFSSGGELTDVVSAEIMADQSLQRKRSHSSPPPSVHLTSSLLPTTVSMAPSWSSTSSTDSICACPPITSLIAGGCASPSEANKNNSTGSDVGSAIELPCGSPPSPTSSIHSMLSPTPPMPPSPTASTPDNRSQHAASVSSTPPMPLSPASSSDTYQAPTLPDSRAAFISEEIEVPSTATDDGACCSPKSATTFSTDSKFPCSPDSIAGHPEIHDLLIFQGPPCSPVLAMFRVADDKSRDQNNNEMEEEKGEGRDVVVINDCKIECKVDEVIREQEEHSLITPKYSSPSPLPHLRNSRSFSVSSLSSCDSPPPVPPTRSSAFPSSTSQASPPSFPPASQRSRRRKTAPALPSRSTPVGPASSAARGKQLMEEVRRARSASIRAAAKKGGGRAECREEMSNGTSGSCPPPRTGDRSGSLSSRSWGGWGEDQEWDGLFWDSFCVYYARHRHTAQHQSMIGGGGDRGRQWRRARSLGVDEREEEGACPVGSVSCRWCSSGEVTAGMGRGVGRYWLVQSLHRFRSTLGRAGSKLRAKVEGELKDEEGGKEADTPAVCCGPVDGGCTGGSSGYKTGANVEATVVTSGSESCESTDIGATEGCHDNSEGCHDSTERRPTVGPHRDGMATTTRVVSSSNSTTATVMESADDIRGDCGVVCLPVADLFPKPPCSPPLPLSPPLRPSPSVLAKCATSSRRSRHAGVEDEWPSGDIDEGVVVAKISRGGGRAATSPKTSSSLQCWSERNICVRGTHLVTVGDITEYTSDSLCSKQFSPVVVSSSSASSCSSSVSPLPFSSSFMSSTAVFASPPTSTATTIPPDQPIHSTSSLSSILRIHSDPPPPPHVVFPDDTPSPNSPFGSPKAPATDVPCNIFVCPSPPPTCPLSPPIHFHQDMPPPVGGPPMSVGLMLPITRHSSYNSPAASSVSSIPLSLSPSSSTSSFSPPPRTSSVVAPPVTGTHSSSSTVSSLSFPAVPSRRLLFPPVDSHLPVRPSSMMPPSLRCSAEAVPASDTDECREWAVDGSVSRRHRQQQEQQHQSVPQSFECLRGSLEEEHQVNEETAVVADVPSFDSVGCTNGFASAVSSVSVVEFSVSNNGHAQASSASSYFSSASHCTTTTLDATTSDLPSLNHSVTDVKDIHPALSAATTTDTPPTPALQSALARRRRLARRPSQRSSRKQKKVVRFREEVEFWWPADDEPLTDVDEEGVDAWRGADACDGW